MTQTYFPFDGTDVTEVEWRKMARLWHASGVLEGELAELLVTERALGANMSVDVAPGRSWVLAHYFESDAVENLAIAAADPANPRIDRVIVRADFALNTVTLMVLTGVAAAVPVAQALTTWPTSAFRHELSLALVAVPAGDLSIGNAQITDDRTLVNVEGGGGAPTLDTLALRPAADGSQGWFIATDKGALYVDDGSWRLVAMLVDSTLSLPDLSNLDVGFTYTGSNPTTITYRDQLAGPPGTKRVEDTLTYNTDGTVATNTRRVYAPDGVTVRATITETYSYASGQVSDIARTVA